MSDQTVIKVENLIKSYKLYDKPIDRLKESFNILKKTYHKDFHALDSVNFNVNKGETFGVIGQNGSGKSTLLKILTGVLNPTEGSVTVSGKVSALLELGAGFNLEYTGLENIYLNGTIMGYSNSQIDEKVESILKFADIGDFIYQPVKLYSSGMFVRLAFAVQACTDPEILIVDEALAVGDAAFSFKCINHMKRLVSKGVTVIFVTHDVTTVRSFCNRVLWLDHGKSKMIGDPYLITTEYVRSLFESKKYDNDQQDTSYNDSHIKSEQPQEENSLTAVETQKETYSKADDNKYTRWGNGSITINEVFLTDSRGKELSAIEWREKIIVKFTAKVNSSIKSTKIGFGFSFRNRNGLDVIVSTTIEEGKLYGPFEKDDTISVSFEMENILAPDDYLLTLQAEDRTEELPAYFDFIENAKVFKVVAKKKFFSVVQPEIVQSIEINERSGIL